jgi:hypothetical protein
VSKLLLILSAMLCCFSPAALALEKGPDTVDIYIVPMDDFPEAVAASAAKFMSDDMKVWAKGTLRLGDLGVQKLPGTNQLIAEEILAKAQPLLKLLPEASDATYFLLLTTQDINSASGDARFQFSLHSKALRTSVISMSRMFKYVEGKPVVDNDVFFRLYKMTKRAIGEMSLGWKRSTDRGDIMYSPIMGLTDLDSIGLDHDTEKPEPVTVDAQPLKAF